MGAIPVEWLVGPLGGFVLALWIIWQLWKAHREADAREQKRADDADARLGRIADAIGAGLERPEPK